MQRAILLLIHVVFTTSVLSTREKYFQILKTCQIIGDDSKQYDVRYKIQYHYNGQLVAQYNSSTETVTGYTDYGRQFADDVNKDINYLSLRRNDLNFFCKLKATVIYKAMLEKTVAPRVSLRMGRSKVVRDSAVLVCTAYDFYPRDIRLTWLRNGQVFQHNSEKLMQEELPSGAWRYQFHSHLEHTPAVGESISCMVEHASLWEPKLYHLDTSDMEAERLLVALAVFGLVLGSVVLAAGALFYRRKATAYRLC